MIEVYNATRFPVSRKFLCQIAERIFKKEKRTHANLFIALVGSARSRELNRRYRKEDTVANTLSFQESELGLGEIILCPEKISQDAKKYGITFKEELKRVFTHSLLHLLGYTHRNMEQKEKRYMKSFHLNTRY